MAVKPGLGELDTAVVLDGPTIGEGGSREAQAMAKLSHPNVVTVHDVTNENGRIRIAMELVEGHRRVARRAALSPRRAWRTASFAVDRVLAR